MIPVLMVAAACFGVALNLYSEKTILLRHPRVQKLLLDTRQWSEDNGRRLYAAAIESSHVERASHRVQEFAERLQSSVRLRLRSATATPVPSHPSPTSQVQPEPTHPEPPRPEPPRSLDLYKGWDVQVYEPPASGICPIDESYYAEPPVNSLSVYEPPTSTAYAVDNSYDAEPTVNSLSVYEPPASNVCVVDESYYAESTVAHTLSVSGDAHLALPSWASAASNATAVSSTGPSASLSAGLSHFDTFLWLPAIVAFVLVAIAMHLIFPSKRAHRKVRL